MRRGETVKPEGERASVCMLEWDWTGAGLDDIEVGDCRSDSGLNRGTDFNIGEAEIFGIE